MKTKRDTGLWWKSQLLGQYAPTLEREQDGSITMLPSASIPVQQNDNP
jgi:hypothetical protein